MNFLLYSPVTRQTGRALAAELGIRAGEAIPANANITFLVRWGSSAKIPQRVNVVLNRREAVALSTDKMRSHLALRQANINTPNTIEIRKLRNLTLQEVTRNGLRPPVLARKFHHTRGTDVILCLQNKDLDRASRWGREYLIEYIPTAREYRIHVFRGNIIKVSQKVLMGRDNYVPYLRNDDHNHTFRNPREELTAAEREVAINAVAVIGLDFGAVDMIIGDDGYPYVLEVNTGPSLIESGIEVYAEAIRNLMRDNHANPRVR